MLVQLHAKPCELAAQCRAYGGRAFADAGGKHQGVQTAEHGHVSADIFRHRVDEMLDRGDRPRIGTVLQHAHVAADAGEAEQARALVQHLLQRRVVEQLAA